MELFTKRLEQVKKMEKLSVIIPNYNGIQYMKGCLESLEKQTMKEFETIVVDNGSQDGSIEFIEKEYPWVRIVPLKENYGFCGAVNIGIREAKTDYVLLLNNDTEAEPEFVEQLYQGIRQKSNAFSGGAMMVQFHDRNRIDDAGDEYSALGWAYARGKGKPVEKYEKEKKVFSACAGAAIYRKKLIQELGYLDEEHFAYLEDMDLGYRARIAGYENWYFPKAKVYHIGSGTTGSRYNQFKIRYSSRNNIYMLRKNMPFLQLIINLPFLILGFLAKFLFFCAKGFGKEYAAGIKNGFTLSTKGKKVPFQWKNTGHYCLIQVELWINMIRRFL